jgi:hypothetical protein
MILRILADTSATMLADLHSHRLILTITLIFRNQKHSIYITADWLSGGWRGPITIYFDFAAT